MACEDQITPEDLTNAKDDAITLAEIATSKEGGVSTGDLIFNSTDRFGNSHLTSEGALARIQANPINGGVWAAGITFNAYNDYMIYTGVAYKPKVTTTLPYVSEAVPNVANVEPFLLNDAGLVNLTVNLVATSVGDYLNNDDVESYIELKAIDITTVGSYRTVNVAGRRTHDDGAGDAFYWLSGDQTTLVALDTNEIVYVRPASDDTGASGIWVRKGWLGKRVNIRWGGANPKLGIDQTTELQNAIDFANARDKGIFVPASGNGVAGLSDQPYYFTTLNVLRHSDFLGESSTGTTEGSGCSSLKQVNGHEGHGLIVDDTGDEVASIYFEKLLILGPDTQTAGTWNGIHVSDSLAGPCDISDCFIRWWKGSGIYTGERIYALSIRGNTSRDNGRYGYEFGGNDIKNLHMTNNTGESNDWGGVLVPRLGSTRNVLIDTVYVEGGGTTPRFALRPTFSINSPWGIELKGANVAVANANVTIRNIVCLGAFGVGLDAGVVNNPEVGDFAVAVDWEGIQLENVGFSGNKSTYYDTQLGQRLGPSFTRGSAGSSGVISYTDYSRERFTRKGSSCTIFNRDTNAGAIIDLYKDDVKVGDVGVESDDSVSISNASGEYGIKVLPDGAVDFCNGELRTATIVSGSSNPRLYFATDNVYDFGNVSNRAVNIYATNGTIQTSDEREKDFFDVSEEELKVAVAAKKLLRKYRWKAESRAGNKIRLGLGAQSLIKAFEAEGLDYSDYDIITFENDRYGVNYVELLAFITLAT